MTKLIEYFNGDDLASNTWLSKYALDTETSPDDMHMRMAAEFAKIEKKYWKSEDYSKNLSEYGKLLFAEHSKSNGDINFFKDKIYNLFKDFKYVVPQGSIMSQLGAPSIGSLSNCFVIGQPEDSYGGIMKKDEEMVQLMKRRGGVGIDISTLRPTGAATSNAAKTSTGAVSFMKRFSNTTGEVAQNGRRGALMISLDINHPNILDFIKIKRDLSKVTAANISIKLNDAFMKAVQNDGDYFLKFPTDSEWFGGTLEEFPMNELKKWGNIYIRRIKAKEYWNEIIKSAHSVAEPGLLFWDRMVNYSPDGVYPEFKQISTNPCVVGRTLVLTNKGWVRFDRLYSEWRKLDVKIITRNKNGELEASELVDVLLTDKNAEIYKIKFDNNTSILTNDKHKLYTELYSEVCVLDAIGKNIITGDGITKCISVTKTNTRESVYDLTAKPNYNFFSLIDGTEQFGDEIDINQIKNTADFKKSILNVDCAEIAMQDGDACRLMVVNLYSFVIDRFTENARFDFDKYYKINYEAMRLSDDLIDLEETHIKRIIKKIKSDTEDVFVKDTELKLWERILKTAKASRRTGLGFTALGDTIASLGIKYDSQDALDFGRKLIDTKLKSELDCTTDMAILRGTFTGWNHSLENPDTNPFYSNLKTNFPEEFSRMQKFGRRNVSWSTMAPAGSLSILTQTTSGIEPLFSPYYTRRKKINLNDGTIRPDFIDSDGQKWQEFQVLHPKFQDWIENYSSFKFQSAYQKIDHLPKSELQKYFEMSPWYESTANDINWVTRVTMQSILQSGISHSISSTINLPNTIKESAVSEIYMEAWKQGLKGITVYRDGSRSGVLITDKTSAGGFKDNNAPKRPKRMRGEIYRFQNNLEKWIAVIGLQEGRPYEIFTGRLHNGLTNLSPSIKTCEIVKTYTLDDNGTKVKHYNMEYTDTDGELQIYKSIDQAFKSEYWNYAKLISGILRHGMPIKSLFELINSLNLEDEHLNTWKNGVTRIIKKFIKDGEKSKDKCEKCGAAFVFENGCQICKSCGNSKCG